MNKFGLIGYPLGHSFSKNFFNQKFQSENINAEYINFEIPNIDELHKILLSNPDLKEAEYQNLFPFQDQSKLNFAASGFAGLLKDAANAANSPPGGLLI